MTSFKRWFGAGAIVLVALALVACPALVPDPVGKITPMTFTVGDGAQTVTDVDDLFTNTDDRSTFVAKSVPETVATASISGTTLTVTPVAEGKATVTITATLSNGKTATTSFMVTVKAKPVDPPDPVDTHNDGPRMFRDLPDLNDLKVDVTPDPIDLSMHFRDDEGDDIDYAAIPEVAGIVGTSVSSDDMLMITVMAPGTTAIHVTATDEHGLSVTESFDVTVINQAPMATDVNAQLSLSMVAPHNMSEVALARHFTDPEGDTLTYSVDSVDPAEGVLTATVSGSALMLTAVDAGAADVTVRAAEMGNTSNAATKVFRVVVTAVPNQAPMVTMEIPDQTLTLVVMDGMESATAELDLADYFEDTDGMPESLMYSDDSDMTMIDGSTLTITADAAASGMTSTITVTASDGADSISDMFDVMVMAPDAPEWKKEIPDVTFEHDGGPQTFMLADYFNRATMYATDDGGGTVVTAAVNDEQTMLTLTRVGAGEAVVEITPSNSGGNGTTQSITVTVAGTPTKPTLKPNAEIPAAIKVTALADSDAGAATVAVLDMAEESYMLANLIRDPDGPDADLVFSTKTEDPKTVAVYETAADVAGRQGITPATLDKMMTDASNITIRGRKEGMAKVTITATDDSGGMESWEIMVTVGGSNDGPSVTGTFPGTGTATTDPNHKFVRIGNQERFKSTETASRKLMINLGAMFTDTNVSTRGSGDSWEFDVDSTDEKVVTAELESTGKTDEYYVVITPKGSGKARIYFTVEDSYGETAGGKDANETVGDITDPSEDGLVDETSFVVHVNHKPMPYSGDGDARKSLSTEDMWMALSAAGDTPYASDVALVDDPTTPAAEGYFSDKDGEALLCRLMKTTGKSVGMTLETRNQFDLTNAADNEVGQTTFRIRCFDQVDANTDGTATDFEWAEDTLTVDVKYEQSIRD